MLEFVLSASIAVGIVIGIAVVVSLLMFALQPWKLAAARLCSGELRGDKAVVTTNCQHVPWWLGGIVQSGTYHVKIFGEGPHKKLVKVWDTVVAPRADGAALVGVDPTTGAKVTIYPATGGLYMESERAQFVVM